MPTTPRDPFAEFNFGWAAVALVASLQTPEAPLPPKEFA